MGKLNTEFMDDSLGFYSKAEDDIEIKVKRHIMNGDRENYKEMDTDEFTYLSPKRSNLFSWYDFDVNANLLEIGSELGALTGYFAKHVKQVTVVENKESRVNIIKERFKKSSNVEVIYDNFSKLSYLHEFDYIVVHDIVGYVKKYIHSENPYVDFLNTLYTYLKDSGTILIATENRLGLKYFSGSVEEYSYKFFTGLNNFDGYDSIKTLSKTEWIDVIKQSNSEYNYQFFYPFPDCIFPYEIHSENSLKKLYYGSNYQDIASAKFDFFNEKEVYKSFKKEGIIDKFTNAFLIEITKKDLSSLFYFSSKNENQKIKIVNNKNVLSIQNQFGSEKIEEYTMDINSFERVEDILIDSCDLCLLSNIKENTFVSKFYDKVKFFVNEIKKSTVVNYSKMGYSQKFEDVFGKSKIIEKVALTNNVSIYTSFKEIFYDCNKNVFYMPHSDNDLDIPLNFYLWKLFYQWFENNVFQAKSKGSKIKFSEINDILGIEPHEADIYKNWYLTYKDYVSDDVEMHMKPIYNKKFVSEIDVAIYGEKNIFSLEATEKEIDDSLTKLLSDDKLLDKIRK